jgi:hypothetical protein
LSRRPCASVVQGLDLNQIRSEQTGETRLATPVTPSLTYNDGRNR